MKTLLYSVITCSLAASSLCLANPNFEFTPGFLKAPPKLETIGNGHGEIQVDSDGNIYVSVEGQQGGIQVYSSDGQYLRHLPLPGSLHGFSIRKHADGEFIYAAVLGQQRAIKADLTGKVVLEIPTSAFPQSVASPITLTRKDGSVVSGHSPVNEGDSLSVTLKDGSQLKVAKADIATKASFTLADGRRVDGINPEETDSAITLTINGKTETFQKADLALKNGAPSIAKASTEARGKLNITGADSASNGDIYVVDGYGTSWIFVFDSSGKFKKQFGGPQDAFKLNNCHKVHVDKRFSPERLLLCDRGNNRILHASLDGENLGVIATDMRRPSSASFHGELMCIAEIAGRVSVWDKEGKMVAELGVNNTNSETNTPNVPPTGWKDNVVTSPHGITFDQHGNILETEWNKFGRVLRWARK